MCARSPHTLERGNVYLINIIFGDTLVGGRTCRPYLSVCQQDESLSDFIASHRKLANSCDFKAVLNDRLQCRLVCGTNNKLMQPRLLQDVELMFNKAVKVVVGIKSKKKMIAKNSPFNLGKHQLSTDIACLRKVQ